MCVRVCLGAHTCIHTCTGRRRETQSYDTFSELSFICIEKFMRDPALEELLLLSRTFYEIEVNRRDVSACAVQELTSPGSFPGRHRCTQL
jgi:hypothetical protein